MGLNVGENWGRTEEVPADAVWIDDDSAARELVAEARRANKSLPRLCLTGGDLCRGLGGGRDTERLRIGGATHVRVDIGAVLIDGRLDWFIAHLIARRFRLRGRVVVVANTDFLGRWNIAPRAHPGDGLPDLVDSNLTLSDRFEAGRRLPSGGHVPHPDIRIGQSAALQLDFDRPIPIRLDGARVGRATRLSVRTETDCLDVWI